jgi:hypothetical protein
MLVIMMTIAPLNIAMSVAVDSIAVLETIRPVVPLAAAAGTTRQIEQSHHHTQAEQRHPIRIFHLITPV